MYDIQKIVSLVLGLEEHYVFARSESRPNGEEPLTPDHLFGQHVLVLKEKKDRTKGSQDHLDQRIRAVSVSVAAILEKEK